MSPTALIALAISFKVDSSWTRRCRASWLAVVRQFCGGLGGPNLDELFEMFTVLNEFSFGPQFLRHITNDPLEARFISLAILPGAGSDHRI